MFRESDRVFAVLEEIEISVEEKFQALVNEDWLKRIAQQVLEAEGGLPPMK